MSTALSTLDEFAFFTPAAKPQANPMTNVMKANSIVQPLSSRLGFGQPFQPPIDFAQLLGICRRLDSVSQVTNHHHIAPYVTFGIIYPVDGRGAVDWSAVYAPLKGYAQYWAYFANRDVGWL